MCKAGWTDGVSFIMSQIVEVPSANRATNETPLHAACEGDHYEIVETLITTFPQLLLMKDKIPYRGWYPIHTACAVNASYKIVAVILVGMIGKHFNSPNLFHNLSFLDSFGYSPLFIASECSNLPHVSVLLHPMLISTILHFVPTLLYNVSGCLCTKCSVMHAAVFGNNLKIITTMMERIPKAKMFLGIPCKMTSLYVSSLLGCYLTSYSHPPMKVCEKSSGELELVSVNAITHAQKPFNHMSISPLALAAVLGRTEVVAAFLDAGMRDTKNLGLRLALFMKHSEIVINLLFHQRTDKTIFEANGRDLLHFPVSPNISEHLFQCTEINIQRNSLTEIPLGLFQIPVLNHLNASHNNLTTLPIGEKEFDLNFDAAEWGWKCKSLQILNVSYNAICTLPEAVWAIPNLEYFDASYNSIVLIGPAKYCCTKLVRINISHNSLVQVAPFLFSCEEVNLSFNKLRSLPVKLWSSKSIKALNVSNNLIAEICFPDNSEQLGVSFTSACTKVINVKKVLGVEQIGASTSLSKLQLADNKLFTFPKDLACFATHLQLLDISFNHISTIDISFLPPYLKTLKATNCHMSHFGSIMNSWEKEVYQIRCISLGIGIRCPHRRHECLQHLSNLKLSNNKLRDMQFVDNSSNNLLYPELTSLYLSANELHGDFSSLVKLQSHLFNLDLSDNPQLESIPMELSLLSDVLCCLKLDNLPRLRDPPKEYHNCHIRELLSYMKQRMEK